MVLPEIIAGPDTMPKLTDNPELAVAFDFAGEQQLAWALSSRDDSLMNVSPESRIFSSSTPSESDFESESETSVASSITCGWRTSSVGSSCSSCASSR